MDVHQPSLRHNCEEHFKPQFQLLHLLHGCHSPGASCRLALHSWVELVGQTLVLLFPHVSLWSDNAGLCLAHRSVPHHILHSSYKQVFRPVEGTGSDVHARQILCNLFYESWLPVYSRGRMSRYSYSRVKEDSL